MGAGDYPFSLFCVEDIIPVLPEIAKPTAKLQLIF